MNQTRSPLLTLLELVDLLPELSLLLVLLIVIFIPSELDFTIYSEFLVSLLPVLLPLLLPSLDLLALLPVLSRLLLPLLDLLLRSEAEVSQCCAFTFNLSTMAERLPLRLRAWLAIDLESSLGEGSPSVATISPIFKSRGFTLREELFVLELLEPIVLDSFLSLSLKPSLELDLLFDSLELLPEGELAAFFRVDMLGLPDPLVEGCFGDVPWCLGLEMLLRCLGLLGMWAGECLGL